MRGRALPIGVELLDGSAVCRVWAPRRQHVEFVLEGGRSVPLAREPDGYFAAELPGVQAGHRYRFRLDGEGQLYPDPASRFQPDGPHGPSQVIDPNRFSWTDQNWRVVERKGQILYELHIGTFTAEGTWKAATERLKDLAELGVSVVEVMPIADFPGRFGWGYDGVNLFAPTRLYGEPDDARRFVDRAHALGLGVILDVVYNHFGPDGNYLKQFSPAYFTDRHANEWGEAINFDGPDSGPVREFFVANAEYWIREFHFDGLRFDATQQIFDDSADHILAEIARAARLAAGDRSILLTAENEVQDARLARPVEHGGFGLDALWNDDFHHSARVALTGEAPAYYSDFRGEPRELVAAAKHGFLYQGQRSAWQKKPRGLPALDLSPEQFVTFLDNHDQVANSADGRRCHQLGSPGKHRALTALLLLGPGTPLLFQGQEFGATSRFLYFADHNADLAKQVFAGRKKFLAQFPTLAQPAAQEKIADPADPKTFEACRLNWGEQVGNAAMLALHRDLIQIRRRDPLLRAPDSRQIDAAVLSDRAFALRWFGLEGHDRLLIVNLGSDWHAATIPEPLVAPPMGRRWNLAWSSESLEYGGGGSQPVETPDGWQLPGEAAVLLAAESDSEPAIRE